MNRHANNGLGPFSFANRRMRGASIIKKSIARARWTVPAVAWAWLSACASQAYEKELFATDHVRVVRSETHCKDLEPSDRSELPGADLVLLRVDGIGYFVATRTAWEIRARQLAAELDADLALIRPCDGERGGLKYAHIEVWRSRGVSSIVREEPPPNRDTLDAPAETTYGGRLGDIFDCLEQARTAARPPSAANMARLAGIDPRDYFSADAYFPGYAKIDTYFRPARSGGLRLSMILSERFRADAEARRYLALSQDSQSLYAEQYLFCLLDRGYRIQAIDSSSIQ